MPRTATTSRKVASDFGTCLSFNGSTSNINTIPNVLTSVFTYAAWINLKGSGNRCIIADSNANNGTEFRIDTNGKLELLKTAIASIATSTGIIPRGTWTHVAVTYDASGNYAFYINGVVSGSGTNLLTFVFGGIFVGKQNTGEFFSGLMDELRVYSRVLAASEILNLYLNNNPSTTNLLIYFKFDEGSGTSALDSSGRGNSGTITSASYSSNVVSIARTTTSSRSSRPLLYLQDLFTDTNSTAISSHTANLASFGGWSQTNVNSYYIQNNTLQPNRQTDGDLATIDSGVSDFSISATIVPSNSGTTRGIPGIVFRYFNSTNFWYAEVDSYQNTVKIYEVNGGSFNMRVEYNTTVTSDVALSLRVDCIGPNIVLYLNGTEIVTYVSTFNQYMTKVGMRVGISGSPATRVSWDNFQVAPFTGTVINWPVFTEYASNPILTLGAGGSWEDTDINNANVVYDAANSRYVLHYSGFDGNAGKQQSGGFAYSTTLPGTWTKDAGNPLFDGLSYGIDSMNGGLVKSGSTWYLYFAASNATVISLATSTDLTNWTVVGTVLTGTANKWDKDFISDAYVRIREDNIWELWYVGSGSSGRAIGYATSSDGVNWTKVSSNAPTLTRLGWASASPIGEPSVYVPTGKEGQEIMVTYDVALSSSSTTRLFAQAVSLDGQQTWHYRTGALQKTSGWMSECVFDSFSVVSNGVMYMFHSGANVANVELFLNSQLGVATAPFPYTSLSYTVGFPRNPVV